MGFIKKYWFALIVLFLMFWMGTVMVLIVLSPKQDAQKRGFIVCTEQMIENLQACERGIFCSSRVVIENNWCVFKVINKGMIDWIQGRQERPWSNYIFEPDLTGIGYVDEEARQEYLKEHPDVVEEMEKLHRLRKDLENEEKKLSADKNLSFAD